MPYVLGRDIAIKLMYGTFKEIWCARTMGLNIVSDDYETTSVGSGDWRSFLVNKHQFTLSLSGVIYLGEDFTIKQITDFQDAKLPIDFEFILEDIAANLLKYSGKVNIMNTDMNGSYNDAGLFNIEMKGTGGLTVTGGLVTGGIFTQEFQNEYQ
jgi:predicted secreted protein